MAKLPGIYEYMATMGAPAINFGRGLLGYQDPFLTQTMQDRMKEIEGGRTQGNVGYEEYGLVPSAGRFTGGLMGLALNDPVNFGLAGSIGKYDFGPEGRKGLEYNFTPDPDTGSTGSAMLDFINRGGVKGALSRMGTAQAAEVTPTRSLGDVVMEARANEENILGFKDPSAYLGPNFNEGILMDYQELDESTTGSQPKFAGTVLTDDFRPSYENYEDLIMNPDYMPNRLQNLERFADNRFEDEEFMPGFDFVDAPNKVSNLRELFMNRNYLNNPRTGFIDNTLLARGNPNAGLVARTRDGIGSLLSRIPTPFNLVRRGLDAITGPRRVTTGMVYDDRGRGS
jgi:hypothetical protein